MTIMYDIHPHALEQAKERFGIDPERCPYWVDGLMKQTVRVHTEHAGREAYLHREKEIFIVVDPKDRLVVTIIDKPAARVPVRTEFMDEVLPVFEEQIYVMKEAYKSKRRAIEAELIDRIENRTAAFAECGPTGRTEDPELATKIKRLSTDIKKLRAELVTLRENYEASAVKVAVFINSCRKEKIMFDLY